MRPTPKNIINIGFYSLLTVILIIGFVAIKNLGQTSLNNKEKAESVCIMIMASAAILYYIGTTKKEPPMHQLQRISSSPINSALKQELALSNKEKLNKFEQTEKAILFGSTVDASDAIEWLSELQQKALFDVLNRDAHNRPLAAVPTLSNYLYWMFCTFFIIFSLILIGVGIGFKIYPEYCMLSKRHGL